MKIFTKKNLILKIVIALVFVILFNFCAPTISRAGFFEEIGGTLIEPLVELFIAIGDAAMNLMQNLLFGLNDSLVKVSTSTNDIFDTLSKIVVGGLAIAVAILVPGIGAGIVAGTATIAAGAYASSVIENTMLPETFYLPMYIISPEEIFKNKIALLDVNFFNPNKYDNITTETGETTDADKVTTSTAAALQSTIANWYLALRNLALVILLSVLLYTGIKIVISSTAQDKAKYKEKLYNWLVAICILFFMHYIMAFATTMVQTISETINNNINKPIALELPKLDNYYIEVRQKNEQTGEMENLKVDANQFFEDNNLKNDQGTYIWPTNLMGQVRLEMQMEPDEYTDDNLLLRKLGYTILFLILVFYTIGFLVMYVKRVIILAFLTIMAPLVAMTYPIDKMNDGNAQAFNMWIKEYLFNLLIQPLHLILYTMLVGSAIEFAKDNIIYAIVALGFILQAEKIMRKFFGFDKASTVESGSTAALGGALAMAGISKLSKIALKPVGKGAKVIGNTAANVVKNKVKERVKTPELLEKLQEFRENNGIEYTGGDNDSEIGDKRAKRFKELITSGMSQEEAKKKVDEELPFSGTIDRNDGYVYNPKKSKEWNRLQKAMQEIFADKSLSIEQRLEKWHELQESDTRGLAQAISDRYQDSKLQRGLNRVGSAVYNHGPVKWTRSATKSIRDFGSGVVETVPKPLRNTIRGATSVGVSAAKYVAPRIGKMALKGGLAATGATLGIAAGLASDSDKNIAKYGAIGAGIGWGVGSGTISATNSIASGIETVVDSVQSEYTISAHGLNAEETRKKEIADRQALKDKDRRKMYSEELKLKSKGDIDGALQSAQQYREYGIIDDKVIIEAMKLDGYGDGLASPEKMLIAGLASEVGNDNKKIKEVQERLESRGIQKETAQKYIDGIRKVTKAL